MAFLGDVGKFFGISTPEAAQIATSYATGGLGSAALATLGALGGERRLPSTVPVDVSGPPAGVDSPATLTRVSQTSQTMAPGVPMPEERFRSQQPMANQAFIGGFGVPGLIQGAGRLLARPGVGGALTGFGAGAVVDFFIDEFGREKKLVITRKLQRDIKKLFMLTGGDARTTSDIYRSATGRFIPEDMIFKILFKTFKNQGPYVTKAAVRKTRQTIRKMETLCDLKDRLCPPKPARRRTTTRRMSTNITQVK
jgi:hypothetical protein